MSTSQGNVSLIYNVFLKSLRTIKVNRNVTGSLDSPKEYGWLVIPSCSK